MKINRLTARLVAMFVMGGLVSLPLSADTPAATEPTISGDNGAAIQAAVPGEKKRLKKPKRVCTREKVTGTNMRRRVCRTQAQMDVRRKNDRRFVRSIQRPAGTESN